MKKNWKRMMAMALLASAMAMAHAYTVVVRESGSNRSYDSDQVSSIVLSTEGDATVMMTDGTQVYVSADEFKSIGFSDGAGVEAVVTPLAFTVKNGAIYSGDGGPIEMYDTTGRLCGKSASGILKIKRLPAGVYVVKTNTVTSKILLK
ncbi:MAG: hypothetical protein LUD17_04800 [Bacteroidales bacterium]|nr:hypothetical protein [Bacteroidales bacterium]